jgi:small-conductance mechanosensitive channel
MDERLRHGGQNIFLIGALFLTLGISLRLAAQAPPSPGAKPAGPAAAAPGAAPAQTPDGAQAQEAPHPPPGVPVVLDGREIMRIRHATGPFTAEMRAATLEKRLEALGKDPSYDEKALTFRENAGVSEFLYRGILIGILTDGDAQAEGMPRAALADKILQTCKDAIASYREEHSSEALWHDAIFALLALTILVGVIYGTRRGQNWIEEKVNAWCEREGWIGRQKAAGAVGHAHLVRGILTALRLLRLVLIVALIYIALALVFSLFPWTRELAGILADYGMAPLRALWQGFLRYIPNLLFITVVCILAYYASRVVRWFFDRVASGEMTIHWMYPEWAGAYYRIARTLVIVGVAVIIFPYIPGSETPAFKGISIFLGALATFGSSTAINNLFNGLVLMSMRPYHTGDWVRVGDTEGKVEDVSLLVTKLRTPKNVVITVPSSQMVGSHILNFSDMAREGPGLILHTTVTIGYDAPWRTVHALLVEAALKTRGVLAEPAPFVLQTSLDDSYVSYQINAFTRDACDQPRLYGELHQNIQEAFNAGGVEIMSPAYHALRDGNTVTIPEAQRPQGYRPPSFRVRSDDGGGKG